MKKLILLLVIILPFCGPDYYFRKAENLQKKGEYLKAINLYKKIQTRFPKYSASALYKIGRIYQIDLKIYDESRKYFERVVKEYPESEEVELANLGILNSPNYFPLVNGNKWVEGDPETKGKNMRIITYCNEITTGVFKVTKTYYAGRQTVKTVTRYLQKKNLQLVEYLSPHDKHGSVLLKYPFIIGNEWETIRDGQRQRITIVDNNITVNIGGQTYDNCLKLRIVTAGAPGAYKYEYHAPGIGKVLTTTASARAPKEYRVAELISFEVKSE